MLFPRRSEGAAAAAAPGFVAVAVDVPVFSAEDLSNRLVDGADPPLPESAGFPNENPPLVDGAVSLDFVSAGLPKEKPVPDVALALGPAGLDSVGLPPAPPKLKPPAGLGSSFFSVGLAPKLKPPAGLDSSFFSAGLAPKLKPPAGLGSSFFSSGLVPKLKPPAGLGPSCFSAGLAPKLKPPAGLGSSFFSSGSVSYTHL